MGQCSRCNPEIHDPGPGLPAEGFDRMSDRREGTSDRCIDGNRLESGFDRPETQKTQLTRDLVFGHQNAKMKLGECCHRDRDLLRKRPGHNGIVKARDQNRRIEQTPAQITHGSLSSLTLPPISAMSSRRVTSGGCEARIRRNSSFVTHCRFPYGPSSATGRPSTVIVNCSPDSACRRIELLRVLSYGFW